MQLCRSDKYCITGPQGVAWEIYRTLCEVEIYRTDMPKIIEIPAKYEVHPNHVTEWNGNC